LSERSIHIGVLLGALALSAWLFGAHVHRAPSHAGSVDSKLESSPLSIIPPGSAFVLSVDVTQLEHAPLGVVLAQRLGQLGSGAGDLTGLCGFDPLAVLDQIALAVPSAGAAASERANDFGVVATGGFSAAQITRCASAAISQRGGDPVSSQLGTFSSVRDRKTDGGEVAARDGGPLIVSGGRYFRDLLDAAEGNIARREHQDPKDAEHAELRRMLGPGTIVATWLLPEGWFERFAGEDSARLSPLRALKALGARLDVGQELRVSLLFECGDAASATEIAQLIEQLRASLGALAQGPTLSDVARRIVEQPQPARLRLNLTLNEAELRAVLDAVLGPNGPAAPPARPATPSIPSSDAVQIPAH
jgi:hypothetical protein